SQSTTSGRSLRRRSDGTVMASTAMLQTARAPLGVSGLLDAAAFLLFQRFGLLVLSLAEALQRTRLRTLPKRFYATRSARSRPACVRMPNDRPEATSIPRPSRRLLRPRT